MEESLNSSDSIGAGSSLPSDGSPLITGVGFAGYRSFAAWQEFLFPTKLTVLAGINNSGKSNVLRFLQNILPSCRGGRTSLALGATDRPLGFARSDQFEVGVPVWRGSLGTAIDLRRGQGQGRPLADYQETLMAVLAGDSDVYWTRFHLDGGSFVVPPSRIDDAISRWTNWKSTFQSVLHALGGGRVDAQDVMRRLMASIALPASLPRIVTITSARRVESTEELEPDWLSGRGIIRSLASLQNPSHDQWEESRAKWVAINAFLKVVLGDANVSLNIPYDYSTIQVETPERVLPLANMGSGVEQVVVLAAAATVTTGSLVCVEEPETNLHPLLQKKLARYLASETDNQYVIATHSSHLLDMARATTYHIRNESRGSIAGLVKRPFEMVDICRDLGYRPSDLLQANCVIWVEGPSDRIYVRRWLEIAAPDLVEGIHYSIMFYGGKLLAHLSASEEAMQKFISLRRLNRASTVLIDSDRRAARARLSRTKKRLCEEFNQGGADQGFSWVTQGYTVENYLPYELLNNAVGVTHTGRTIAPFGQWDNPLNSVDKFAYDKVGIAHAVEAAMQAGHLSVFDLRARLRQLEGFVRAANVD